MAITFVLSWAYHYSYPRHIVSLLHFPRILGQRKCLLLDVVDFEVAADSIGEGCLEDGINQGQTPEDLIVCP